MDFIAEELVDGVTLRQQLASGPMPLDILLDAAAQVAAALEAAHQAGIVHRDIKPENLMIRKDGLVKVLDFGLARFVERTAELNDSVVEGRSLTIPGLILGTVKYMSPEQIRGLPVDHRSDLFSLGVVMYEMATGIAPFNGPTPADTLASILANEPPRIASYAPHLPAEFERLTLRCMEKDREARYATAESLRQELNALARRIAASETLLPVAGGGPRSVAVKGLSSIVKSLIPTPIRRRRRMLLSVLAGIVVVVTALVFVLRSGRDHDRTTVPFVSMKISRLMLRAPVLDAAIGPDGKRLAYVLKEGEGESIWLTDLVSSRDMRQATSEIGGYSGVTFSPTGDYLYFRRNTATQLGTEYRVPVAGSEKPVRVLDNIGGDVALSPDGRQLAFVRIDPSRLETALIVANADGKNPHTVAICRRPQYFSNHGLAWSFDKRWIICFAGNSMSISSHAFQLQQIRVEDGWRESVSTKTWEWVDSLVWPARTDTLLVDGTDSREDAFQISKVSLTTGAYSKVTNDLSSYQRLTVTRDGKTLSAVQTEQSSSLWVKSTQKRVPAIQISSGDIYGLDSIAWTPAAKIVYTAMAGDYRNIWITDPTGSSTAQLTFDPKDKAEVATTSDGRYILYQAEGKIWRVNSDGRDARQLTSGALDVHPAPSADNRYVVYASFVGWSPAIGARPTLWRVSIDGDQVTQLTRKPTSLPQVSPDGKLILCGYYPDNDPRFSSREIAVLPSSGGESLELLDNVPDFDGGFFWTPEGTGITFSRAVRGIGNIWRQRLKGGPPTQLTNFASDDIFTFRFSPDGKWLAMARGKRMSDVVLIKSF